MTRLIRKLIFINLLGCCVFLLSACATTPATDPRDPFESYNRKVFAFNSAFDKVLLTPTARTYNTVVPWPVRAGIDNFFANLFQLPVIANDILQGEINMAVRDVWRFAINSTLGVAGFIDVATHVGLERNYQDLGITLARWGDKNSPYFILPILGPSTVRDAFGLAFDYRLFTVYEFINPAYLRYSILGFESFTYLAQYQEAKELTEQLALDPYILQREAYLQRRDYLVNLLANREQLSPYVEGSAEDYSQETPELYVEDDDEFGIAEEVIS